MSYFCRFYVQPFSGAFHLFSMAFMPKEILKYKELIKMSWIDKQMHPNILGINYRYKKPRDEHFPKHVLAHLLTSKVNN